MALLLRLCLAAGFFTLSLAATARPEMNIARTPVAPVLDGKLDDEAWSNSKLSLGEWLTYNPVRGDKLAQTTEVWCTYDRQALYFAFRCLDPEPKKVKTSISRRDNIFTDDWVGLSLDAMFAGQTSYDMFVNADGIQADILTSSASGEDVSPDWVWESAGRQTAQGYEVEARLPLESIRFKSGAEVRMGLLFWRRVSRLGSSASWPAIESGKSVFECHATAIFENLSQPRALELIPSLTYSHNQDLESPGRWGKAQSEPDAGITVKYGLTSSIAAEAAVNPDFSQVESDAFQVEVNQRYPIFFSEKRLFFMEGMSIFSLAGITGDGNMLATVHTRRIVDPLWGLKFTGTVGRVSFGTLSAADESPGRALEDGSVNPFLDKKRYFNIGRALYSLGKGTYIGGFLADTQIMNELNRVAGSDVSLRVGEHQSISGTFLGSTSRSDAGARKNGIGAQMTYGYSSDRINAFTQIEHYDQDFQMDTAFYRRTGVSTGWAFFGYNIDPDKKKYPWIRQITPLVFTRHGRDRIEGGHESIVVMGANFRFTRQGFMRIDWAVGKEPWAGRIFDNSGFRIFGNAQFTRWLNGSAFFFSGDGVFYDREDPYQGRQRNYEAGVTFQPTPRISQNVFYSHVDFDRASSGERVYSVNLINTRSTYQFNRHFSLRAIVQFDSSRYRVLTDFLGSYELVPGTVAYAGYGSLFNKQAWRDEEWHLGEGTYLTTRRGFFFKVSYLQRF
ncbi:MAG: DUF5916 domain-containing protein [Acidobacteriota bacterium]